jgi:hypothetical protein
MVGVSLCGGVGSGYELVPVLAAVWMDIVGGLAEEAAVHTTGLVETFDCVTQFHVWVDLV